MRILAILFALFVLVPLLELVLLLYLAYATHPLWTLGVILVTGMIGAPLAKSQGWRTMRRIQQELAENRMPAESLVDAVMIFVAGALLLTPGLLTDLFGFSLLTPVCRRWYRRCLSRWFAGRFRVMSPGDPSGLNRHPHATSRPEHGGQQARDEILDAEVLHRHE